MLRTSLAIGLLCLSLASPALAQQATDDLPPAPPPPPPAEAAPAQGAPAPAAPVCTPACRSGFTCMQGQCVSACNPPCAAGQQCTAQGECVGRPPPPPPPNASIFPQSSESSIVPPPNPGKERHDGFMLRLALGFGGASMKEKLSVAIAGVTSDQISGFSGTFSLDVGGGVSDELVIHARLADFVLVDPTVKVAGMTATANNTTFAALLFGPALSYYIMPANVYLTAAIGLSWLNYRNQNGDSATTDIGPGFNLDIGKEWWVSDNWGLGVAARFWYTHVNGKDSSLEYKDDFIGFGVLFSATYQ